MPAGGRKELRVWVVGFEGLGFRAGFEGGVRAEGREPIPKLLVKVVL